jgi:hypothetical protein
MKAAFGFPDAGENGLDAVTEMLHSKIRALYVLSSRGQGWRLGRRV